MWEDFKIPFVYSTQQYTTKPCGVDYARMTWQKRSVNMKKMLRLLVSGHSCMHNYKNKKRSKENFIGTNWICVDVDGADVPMHIFCENAFIKPSFGYLSYSNSDKIYKYHLFFVFSYMLNAEEFTQIYDQIVAMLNLQDTKDHCGRNIAQLMNGTYGTDKEFYFSGIVYNPDHFLNDPMPYLRQLFAAANNIDAAPLFGTVSDLISFYDHSEEFFGYPKYRAAVHNSENTASKYPKPEKGTAEYDEQIEFYKQRAIKESFLKLTKKARLVRLQHIKEGEFKDLLQRLDEDEYDIAKYDATFTEKELEYYADKLNIPKDDILEIQSEIRKYGYNRYVKIHKKDFNITTRTPVKMDRARGCGRAPEEFFELFYQFEYIDGNPKPRKRRNGEKRRKCLWIDGLTLLKITPNMLLDEMVFNLVHRVLTVYDNSDFVLTPHCILRKAMDAMITTNEGRNYVKCSPKSGRLIISDAYCIDTHRTKRAVAQACLKLYRYDEIDTWYNSDLTPRENYLNRKKTGLKTPSKPTLKRYAKFNNYKTFNRPKSVMNFVFSWYNIRKSVR